MKITAQEEYGLRCLVQLAQAEKEKGLTVKEVATREGLSSAYVEKLLRLLSRSGLIHSVRGMKGGYLLNRRPQEIRLTEVIKALGNIPTTREICDRFTGNRQSCVHIDNCCIRSAWATLTQMLENFLEGTFLSDLIGPETKARQAMGNRIVPVQTRFSIERA